MVGNPSSHPRHRRHHLHRSCEPSARYTWPRPEICPDPAKFMRKLRIAGVYLAATAPPGAGANRHFRRVAVAQQESRDASVRPWRPWRPWRPYGYAATAGHRGVGWRRHDARRAGRDVRVPVPPRTSKEDVCCRWRPSMRTPDDPEYVHPDEGRGISGGTGIATRTAICWPRSRSAASPPQTRTPTTAMTIRAITMSGPRGLLVDGGRVRGDPAMRGYFLP